VRITDGVDQYLPYQQQTLSPQSIYLILLCEQGFYTA